LREGKADEAIQDNFVFEALELRRYRPQWRANDKFPLGVAEIKRYINNHD
jgi:hypothetical protein